MLRSTVVGCVIQTNSQQSARNRRKLHVEARLDLLHLISTMKGLTCEIDGVAADPTLVGLPPMNFGQAHRWSGFRPVRYSFHAAVDDFIASIGPWFDRHRQEVIDDLVYETPELGSLDHAYMELGHPPLSQFLAMAPETAASYLREWPLELLQAINNNSVHSRYVVNSLDLVSMVHGVISMSGVAFDRQSR